MITWKQRRTWIGIFQRDEVLCTAQQLRLSLLFYFYFTKNNKNILRKKIYIENCFASNLGTDDRKETSNGFAHCATFLNFFEFGFEHPT